MKKQILTAIAVMASLCGYAQTKGTSALGFGVSSQKDKTDFRDQAGLSRTDERTTIISVLKYTSYSKH